MSSNAGLTFRLFGDDVSASQVLEGVGKNAQGAVKTIAGAFAGLQLGSMISDEIGKGLDSQKVIARFKAGLGQTPKVAEQVAKVVGDVWKDSVDGTMEDAAAAVSAVGTELLDLGRSSPAEIKRVAQAAQDLAYTMGEDVTSVTRAAGQMMRNGLAPDAMYAFDIIAQGYHNGSNASGDLLDTLTEYSPHFAKLGIDGPTALSMIKSAMDQGIFTTDLAADAVKEFAIRSIDGSTSTAEAYQALGLDADDMARRIAAGGPTATAAFSEILTGLAGIPDPIERNRLAVSLFGTQWEDAGFKAIQSMDPTAQKTDDLKGRTEEMGNVLRDTAEYKVGVMRKSFDQWKQSMINTDGWIGTVSTTMFEFGPDALAMAGNVGMIAAALKLTGAGAGLASWGMGALALAASPLVAIAAAIGGVLVLLKTAIDRIDVLKRNWQGLMSGNLGQISSFGTFDGLGTRGGANGGFGILGHAAGGITTAPHLAWVGEGGESELILPLSKAPEVLGQVMGGAGHGGPEVHIHVNGTVAGTYTDLARTVTDAITVAERSGTLSRSWRNG